MKHIMGAKLTPPRGSAGGRGPFGIKIKNSIPETKRLECLRDGAPVAIAMSSCAGPVVGPVAYAARGMR